MAQALTEAFPRYAEAHLPRDGFVRTAVGGLYALRASRAGERLASPRWPMVCFVAQGAKEVTEARSVRVLEAGSMTLVLPAQEGTSRVVDARRDAAYLALAFRPDPRMVADLLADMSTAGLEAGDGQPGACTDAEAGEAAARLLGLLTRPASRPVLEQPLRRELHYWLLSGRHGPQLIGAMMPRRHADRIARALALIRRDFRGPLDATRLAAVAGLGLSAFYEAFRGVTSTSPLQYQKRLRLAHARSMLAARTATVSQVAYAVGYESVSQFVRDYRSLYGTPPGRDSLRAAHRTKPL